jgi:carbon-monoxide dehydrogenase small subunit
MELIRVQFKVNGEQVDLSVKPYETLLETLRNRLELTGTKEGCGLGSCGACTVLLDGIPVRSCLLLTAEVNGREVTTIEGLKQGDKLHPLQEAFINHGAVQCGFCTPGMILTAKALLDRNPKPTRSEVIRAISSNICRCTGYKKIIEAIESVVQKGER